MLLLSFSISCLIHTLVTTAESSFTCLSNERYPQFRFSKCFAHIVLSVCIFDRKRKQNKMGKKEDTSKAKKKKGVLIHVQVSALHNTGVQFLLNRLLRFLPYSFFKSKKISRQLLFFTMTIRQ